jgi:hypothetical protein
MSTVTRRRDTLSPTYLPASQGETQGQVTVEVRVNQDRGSTRKQRGESSPRGGSLRFKYCTNLLGLTGRDWVRVHGDVSRIKRIDKGTDTWNIHGSQGQYVTTGHVLIHP